MRQIYEYRAKVLKVVDGDTLHLDVDLGCDTHILMTVRLFGLNAPERGTPEGTAATEFVEQWVAEVEGNVILETIKDRKEKYGRYLGVIYPKHYVAAEYALDPTLNRALIEGGYAVVYP